MTIKLNEENLKWTGKIFNKNLGVLVRLTEYGEYEVTRYYESKRNVGWMKDSMFFPKYYQFFESMMLIEDFPENGWLPEKEIWFSTARSWDSGFTV